jgi:hypothetical protein
VIRSYFNDRDSLQPVSPEIVIRSCAVAMTPASACSVHKKTLASTGSQGLSAGWGLPQKTYANCAPKPNNRDYEYTKLTCAVDEQLLINRPAVSALRCRAREPIRNSPTAMAAMPLGEWTRRLGALPQSPICAGFWIYACMSQTTPNRTSCTLRTAPKKAGQAATERWSAWRRHNDCTNYAQIGPTHRHGDIDVSAGAIIPH